MELLFAATLGIMVGCSVYLMLRARTFAVVLGLILLSYAVNLFLFASGRLTPDGAPLVGTGVVTPLPDPLPQALVLTAIVIGFAMTAVVIVLALRSIAEHGSDHVDGRRERES